MTASRTGVWVCVCVCVCVCSSLSVCACVGTCLLISRRDEFRKQPENDKDSGPVAPHQGEQKCTKGNCALCDRRNCPHPQLRFSFSFSVPSCEAQRLQYRASTVPLYGCPAAGSRSFLRPVLSAPGESTEEKGEQARCQRDSHPPFTLKSTSLKGRPHRVLTRVKNIC